MCLCMHFSNLKICTDDKITFNLMQHPPRHKEHQGLSPEEKSQSINKYLSIGYSHLWISATETVSKVKYI